MNFSGPCRYFNDIRSSKSNLLVFVQIFAKWHKLYDKTIISILNDLITQIDISLNLLDDILDDSETRRGKPCAHRVFEKPPTLFSCFLNFTNCISKIDKIEEIDLIKKDFLKSSIIKWVDNTIQGMALEKHYSDNLIVPNEEEIKSTIILKCSSTLKCINQMVKSFTESELQLDTVCDLFALYGQMNNDLDTFINKEYFEQKKFGEDITEGKFSIPIVHAINSNLSDRIIINILKQRAENNESKQLVIDLMEKYGSIDYAKKLIQETKFDLIKELNKFEENEIMNCLISKKYENFT